MKERERFLFFLAFGAFAHSQLVQVTARMHAIIVNSDG